MREVGPDGRPDGPVIVTPSIIPETAAEIERSFPWMGVARGVRNAGLGFVYDANLPLTVYDWASGNMTAEYAAALEDDRKLGRFGTTSGAAQDVLDRNAGRIAFWAVPGESALTKFELGELRAGLRFAEESGALSSGLRGVIEGDLGPTINGGGSLASPRRLPGGGPGRTSFGALPQGRLRAARDLAIELGLESRSGRTLFDVEDAAGILRLNTGYGNPNRIEHMISRSDALSRQQLLELSEYFGLEISQTSIMDSAGQVRHEIRFGHIDATGRHVVNAGGANVFLGERIIAIDHTHPGNGAGLARLGSGMDHTTAANPFGVGIGQPGVPVGVISRNWDNGRVISTISLPQLPGTIIPD
jgi:hypothetical protein